MNEALQDWLDHCEGKKEGYSCGVLGLFKSGLDSDELDLALAPFPKAAEIKKRLLTVLSAGELGNYAYLQPRGAASSDELLLAARRWLDEQVRYCVEQGDTELHHFAAGARVVLVDQKTYYQELTADQPGAWISEFIGDNVRDVYSDTLPIVHGLNEALYGIAADYDLAYYVMQPLLDCSIDFSVYFDFWRIGGSSILTEQGLLVAGHPAADVGGGQ